MFTINRLNRCKVRVISKRKLREYYLHNPQAKLPLVQWYRGMLKNQARHISELRQAFNSVDPVGIYTIFNISGNHYRLVTSVHYNRQCCYIREIWTHAQYSKRENQQKLQQRQL